MYKLLATVLLSTGFLFSNAARADIILDPQGDAVALFGIPGPVPDLKSMEHSVIGPDLYVRLDFFNPIAAPSAVLPNSVVGYIEFDTDQNNLTGTLPEQFFWGFPTPYFGIDYYVDLFTEEDHAGTVEILDAFDVVTGTADITYGADFLELLIPLTHLGGDDGMLDATALIGTFAQPTDALHDVPAPGTLLLTLLPGLLALRRLRRAR